MYFNSLRRLAKILGAIFVFIVVFLFYGCEQDTLDNRRASRFRSEETGRFVPTNNEGRFEPGRYISGEYEGALCMNTEDHEREECEEICDEVYGKDADLCRDLPVDLIRSLDELYRHLQRPQQIRDGEDALYSRLDEYAFGVMLDISLEPMLRLIRQWNNREAKEFLIWLAQSPGASAGIKVHDTEHKILIKAFGKVVSQTVVADIVKYGIAADLKGFGDTFLVLAEGVKNIEIFDAIHDLINKFCSSAQCKLIHYCVSIKNERTPSYRSQCDYFRGSRFTFSNVEYCYVHGPNVWNYWSDLHRQGLIVDDTFQPNFEITADVCNNICSSNINLCERKE